MSPPSRSVTKPVEASSSSALGLHYYLSFQSGTSLERVPDDVLHEILSYLPSLAENHVLLGGADVSDELVRTPVLRALSRTSRLLRSRCLFMAWRNVELSSVRTAHFSTRAMEVADATLSALRLLNDCPYLWPAIRTVTVVPTESRPSQVVLRLVACLSKLPNLTTLHVLHASHVAERAIKREFQGRQFLSVRKITLPALAHVIITNCPNVEEVINISGTVDGIVESLIEGNCREVRILKGVTTTSLKRLVELLPKLRHIEVLANGLQVVRFADFPLLDTIELRTQYTYFEKGSIHFNWKRVDPEAVNAAKDILRANASSSLKRIILSSWMNGTVTYKVKKV